MDELEVHLKSVPSHVKIKYLVDKPHLTRWRKRKTRRKLPLPIKIYDETMLNPVRKSLRKTRLNALAKQADAIVDFDATFYTDLKKIAKTKPVIGFYHFSIPENLKRSHRHTNRQMNGMSLYSAIALISDTMVEEGKQLYPALSPLFHRIYNGYNADILADRASKPLPEGVTPQSYFVSVARLEESQKDTTTLLRAYALLYSHMGSGTPDLRMIGNGKDRKKLEALASELGIAHKALFMGFQPDAAPWIKNSIGLILSSKYEGFGLVLVEAMTLGVPVIATDCPSGPAEVLDNGNAGILLPVGDAEAISHAMQRLATDADFRAEYAQKAVARSAMFDIHTSVNQLLDICFNG